MFNSGLWANTAALCGAAAGASSATWATTNGVNKNANLSLNVSNLAFTQITYAGNMNGIRASRAASPTAFEFECTLGSSPASLCIGIDDGTFDYSTTSSISPTTNAHNTCISYNGSGTFQTYKNGSWTGGQVSVAGASAVITVICDRTAGTIAFYVNGTQLGSTVTGVSYASWNAFATNQDFAGNYDVTANFAGPFTTGTSAAY